MTDEMSMLSCVDLSRASNLEVHRPYIGSQAHPRVLPCTSLQGLCEFSLSEAVEICVDLLKVQCESRPAPHVVLLRTLG